MGVGIGVGVVGIAVGLVVGVVGIGVGAAEGRSVGRGEGAGEGCVRAMVGVGVCRVGMGVGINRLGLVGPVVGMLVGEGDKPTARLNKAGNFSSPRPVTGSYSHRKSQSCLQDNYLLFLMCR